MTATPAQVMALPNDVLVTGEKMYRRVRVAIVDPVRRNTDGTYIVQSYEDRWEPIGDEA